MFPKTAYISAILSLCLLPLGVLAQKPPSPKSPSKLVLDSLSLEARDFSFKPSSISPDTSKSMLRVRVFDKSGDSEPIQGATVLLRRDKDKMLGRVTKHDGRCWFAPVPATYTVRVQMTGLKSFEKSGFNLEAGKVYDLEVKMEKN